MAIANKSDRRQRRHQRIRRKVFGTPERLRLSVFRSNQHIYAQLIDDTTGRTLVAASSRDLSKETSESKGVTSKVAVAQRTGKLLAEKAVSLNISSVVFDRGGYPFHGRVKGLADGSREAGLVF